MHWWYRVMSMLSMVHVLDCWRHMSVTGIQITSNSVICSTACSGYQQRKHQRSALMNHCHWPRLLVHSPLFEEFNPIRNMDLLQLCSVVLPKICSWWRRQMETFSALLAFSAGNSPVPGEFPAQRPVTRSFDVFFDLRLNKRLSKHSWGWWFETLPRPLWRHRNVQRTC